MGTAKKEINLNITIDLAILRKSKLTLNEYATLEYILRSQADPTSNFSGWCIVSKREIADALNLSQVSVFNILKKLLGKGFIERHEQTKFIRVSNLYYSLTNFSPYKDSLYPVKQEKESTKEKEYINILSPSEKGGVVKKQPSCPLLNGSPLKAKYPQGHTECVEYLQDEEEHRGNNFINHAKQYQAIHKILKAGYGFDKMEKTRLLIEKKYGAHSWDYLTMANWLEKGAGN